MINKFAVIGNPIDFSKSPFIHTSFAKSTNQEIEYLKILGPLGKFKETVDEFRKQGGQGINITAPFKLDAFQYATKRSQAAELAGAANALRFEKDQVIAENFDGKGLVCDVINNLGYELKNKRILLLGSGGAARGALLPLLAEIPEQLVISNRTASKAINLAKIAQKHKSEMSEVSAIDMNQLGGIHFDVIFNATSASLRDELLPIPLDVFGSNSLAYELAYGKGLTPFLRLAQKARSCQIADGVGMLAEQAAEAFAWWMGVRPNTQDVISKLKIPLE